VRSLVFSLNRTTLPAVWEQHNGRYSAVGKYQHPIIQSAIIKINCNDANLTRIVNSWVNWRFLPVAISLANQHIFTFFQNSLHRLKLRWIRSFLLKANILINWTAHGALRLLGLTDIPSTNTNDHELRNHRNCHEYLATNSFSIRVHFIFHLSGLIYHGHLDCWTHNHWVFEYCNVTLQRWQGHHHFLLCSIKSFNINIDEKQEVISVRRASAIFTSEIFF